MTIARTILLTREMWIRRRWLDFRQGHGVYLIFLMTFANFIIIQYALLIERVPTLSAAFGSLWIFASIFIAAYIPLAIIIGYWHRKSQWKVEQEAVFNENVIGARMWLFMLELIDGKVTEEEKKQMRNMLRQIIKKNPVDKKPGIDSAMDEESRPIEQHKDSQK